MDHFIVSPWARLPFTIFKIIQYTSVTHDIPFVMTTTAKNNDDNNKKKKNKAQIRLSFSAMLTVNAWVVDGDVKDMRDSSFLLKFDSLCKLCTLLF